MKNRVQIISLILLFLGISPPIAQGDIETFTPPHDAPEYLYELSVETGAGAIPMKLKSPGLADEPGWWLAMWARDGQLSGSQFIDLPERLTRIYILYHLGDAADLWDGDSAGEIVAYYADGGYAPSIELVAGQTCTEWAYERTEDQGGTISHALLPPDHQFYTFSRVTWPNGFWGYAYLGIIDVDPTRPLDRIRNNQTRFRETDS